MPRMRFGSSVLSSPTMPRSSKGLAVLIRRNADAANEVAPHGFRGAEAAPGGDRDDGVVGLFELPARGLGANAFDVVAGRLTDLVGEHAGEMARSLRRAAGQGADCVRLVLFGLDGAMHLTDRGPR